MVVTSLLCHLVGVYRPRKVGGGGSGRDGKAIWLNSVFSIGTAWILLRGVNAKDELRLVTFLHSRLCAHKSSPNGICIEFSARINSS
jgi:hypothetical protein